MRPLYCVPAALLASILAMVSLVSPDPAGAADATTPTQMLSELFASVPADAAPSGVLSDRVLGLARLHELDGGVYAPAVSLARWRQTLHELRRASMDTSALPSPDELRMGSVASGATKVSLPAKLAVANGKTIPLALLDYRYDRLRPDALQEGKAQIRSGKLHLEEGALEGAQVFSATALQEYSYQGHELSFVLPDEYRFSNRSTVPERYLLDAADGLGPRELDDHGTIDASYDRPGHKTLRLSAVYADGTVMNAYFAFTVKALAAPAPDDTLQLTASIPYNGSSATGDAYLYYAPGHNSLVQPLLLIEGFDLDDSLNWDEIYELLNAANLIEDLRAAGYDIVVLNFDDATTEIQRNSMLVVELIQQVQQITDPRAQFSVAGASMGGLCSRYALAYMEQNALPHRVNTWISFDAPHGGANIPLGLQYWLDFFSGESSDAEFLLSRLDRPAARQLLVYHHASAAGLADPLRGSFLADLASVGNYPSQPRRVAIANGSSSGQTQGYSPGAQLIRWEFDNVLTQITGNVWAVGDGPNTRIFDGAIKILFIPIDDQEIFVSGTDPFDNAPGGSRASMQQAGDTEAPYGDIIALHASHCFIPTISALGLDTSDLSYDVDGDANLLALSNFDALYFPVANQEHVQVTAENAQWIKDELFSSPTAAGPTPLVQRKVVLHQNVPNPFNPSTTIRFEVFEAGATRLELHDVRGRLVATLVDESLEIGEHRVVWDGKDARGRQVGSGMYLGTLSAGEYTESKRLILAR